MSLQVDYRPSTFSEFVGNKDTITSLQNVLNRDNVPNAFLFTGSGGTGKTTLGRIVRKELKCHDADFREINASNDTSVAGIRSMIESVKFAPLSGDTKVILYDEAHMLSKSAQEAMLKVLEEPPSYVTFVICTTNPEALKQTFKRRCHHYDLDALKNSELMGLIRKVTTSEKVKFPKSIATKICELADGSAGQALKLLDQVIDFKDTEKAIAVLKSAGTNETEVIEICRVLVNTNIKAKTKWLKVSKLLKDLKSDGESARRPIMGYLSSVMLNNGNFELAMIMEEFKDNFFDSGKAGLVLACYKSCYAMEE